MASTCVPQKLLVVLENDEDDLIEDKSAAGSDEYTYDPLSDSHCFRLVNLLPGKGTSKLECDVSIHSLDAAPRPLYRAISYTWMESKYDKLMVSGQRISGFPALRKNYSIRHLIWCDGRRFLISTNLRDALRRFRHSTLPLTPGSCEVKNGQTPSTCTFVDECYCHGVSEGQAVEMEHLERKEVRFS